MDTENDPKNRPTIFDRLKKLGVGRNKDHLKSIGRLYVNTEGLLLITNNGHTVVIWNYQYRLYIVRIVYVSMGI